ncbi:hypothetical protein [Nostoc linckia]|nr:hypothetical protein [Nostoc linckia]
MPHLPPEPSSVHLYSYPMPNAQCPMPNAQCPMTNDYLIQSDRVL